MNGCRRAMGRDCIASRATRPKSMSVLRHAVVKRSRKDIGPLSRSTIEGRHPETSRFFRYEPDCRRPQRRCLVSSCVKIGAPTMRALNDHRKFRSGGAIVGAGLVGLVPESVLELILGLALAYSTLVTLRQLNVEIPAEPRVDPLAMSFELEGAYYDAGLDRDVKYRAARVRTGFGAMFGAGLLSGLLG